MMPRVLVAINNCRRGLCIVFLIVACIREIGIFYNVYAWHPEEFGARLIKAQMIQLTVFSHQLALSFYNPRNRHIGF